MAHMALGMSALEAAKMAREITAEAVAAGLRDLGSGPGPDVRIANRRPS